MCVCVCVCVPACVCACVRACVRGLRIVSRDKILRLKSTFIIIIKTTTPVPIQHVSITAYCGSKSPGLASTVTQNISGVCRGDESEPTTGHYLLQAGVAGDLSGDSEEVGHVRETKLVGLHPRQWWSDNFWAHMYKELIDHLIAFIFTTVTTLKKSACVKRK